MIFSLTLFRFYSSALEELSVRSNIALSQKKFVRELDYDSEELAAEYVALCAQVVSKKRIRKKLNIFTSSVRLLNSTSIHLNELNRFFLG
jgi:hypothetical protein